MLNHVPDDVIFEILSYFTRKYQIQLLCNVSKRFQQCALKLHFNWDLFNKDALKHENLGKQLLEKYATPSRIFCLLARSDTDLKTLNPTPFSISNSVAIRRGIMTPL
jgi:hypothetical protein